MFPIHGNSCLSFLSPLQQWKQVIKMEARSSWSACCDCRHWPLHATVTTTARMWNQRQQVIATVCCSRSGHTSCDLCLVSSRRCNQRIIKIHSAVTGSVLIVTNYLTRPRFVPAILSWLHLNMHISALQTVLYACIGEPVDHSHDARRHD